MTFNSPYFESIVNAVLSIYVVFSRIPPEEEEEEDAYEEAGRVDMVTNEPMNQ